MSEQIAVPESASGALDLDWLTRILQKSTPGCRVTDVQLVETIRVVATKLRVRLTYAEGRPQGMRDLCIKGFFDTDEYMRRWEAMSADEANFYDKVQAHAPIRSPRSPYATVDPKTGLGLIVMEDLQVAGARFLGALENIGVDMVAKSLEQLAGLHATFSKPGALAPYGWLKSVLVPMSQTTSMSDEKLQALLDAERGRTLSRDVLDAARIHRALKPLAAIDQDGPRTILHGDCHGGNMYEIDGQPGFADWQLLQQGHWPMEVAYHMGTSLTVEEAEGHERQLFDHYLAAFRAAGGDAPDRDTAWDNYRRAVLYGYYMWIVTLRVDERITHEFCHRMGHSMMRHDTLDRLEKYAA